VKKKVLQAYKDEMRNLPHSRSIENLEYLARHRGCCVGMDAAEVFMVVRCLK